MLQSKRAHFLEIRYSGQDFSLPVPVDPRAYAEDYAATVHAAFNEVHRSKFGYHDGEQALENCQRALGSRRRGEDVETGGPCLPDQNSAPVRPLASRPVVSRLRGCTLRLPCLSA